MREHRVRTICERQHRTLRRWTLSVTALGLLVLTNTCNVRADEIATIDSQLVQYSPIPIDPSAALSLATNIWDAHESTLYALDESDSLDLSIASVLRAIMLSAPATEIVNSTLTPIPWFQSILAIDDRVAIEITVNGIPCNSGCTIDFGDVAIGSSSGVFIVDAVQTPEPITGLLAGVGLALLVIRRKMS